jgi:hypothetical protein
MALPADLTDRTPAEIDGELFPLWAQRWTLTGRIARANATPRAHLVELIPGWESELETVTAAAEVLEAEYDRRGGWARYFLVMNANGHLHRSTDCSTCNHWGSAPTEFCMVADSSGLGAEALIERYAEVVCSVCFPDAPSTPAYARGIARSKAESEAARSAKERAKLDVIEGRDPKKLGASEVFAGPYGRIETVHACWDLVRSAIEYGITHSAEANPRAYVADRAHLADLVVSAEAYADSAKAVLLARGVSPDEIAKVEERKAKAVRKEWGL